MAKKTETKEKAFGDFRSAEELNQCAAGLKAEGDIENLKALAEENGIDPDMAQLFIDGEIPELCDDETLALARLNEELNSPSLPMQEKHLIESVIKPYLDSVVTDPDIRRAILDGKHTMLEIAKQMWHEASKIKVNNGAFIPDEEIRDKTEEYYRK